MNDLSGISDIHLTHLAFIVNELSYCVGIQIK